MKEYISSKSVFHQLSNLNQLVFEVTDSCNLKCKYCGYGELYNNYDERNTKSLSTKSGLLVLDYLGEIWQNNPSISRKKNFYMSFYGGEPLLNMEFIKNIVNHVKALKIPHKKFQFSMTTNAVLLHKYMDFLVENNFSILISLDGDKDSHSYRVDHLGRNSFDKVFANVELLRQKHPSFFRTNVNFNSVLHNRNNVSDISKFISDNFNKRARVSEINASGISPEKKELFLRMYKNKLENISKEEDLGSLQNQLFLETPTVKNLVMYLRQYSGNFFNSYNDLFIDEKKSLFVPTGTCSPFSKKMFVTVNGKILPCERIGHKYALGQVTDTEIDIDLDRIANMYNYWYNRFEKQCKKCSLQTACTKCIFTIDDIDTNTKCDAFMNKERFLNYSNKQMEFLRENPNFYKRIIESVIIE